ncbi:MAG: Aldehyde:ferredoxin oxidoreductase [Thermodesulfobacterium sp.]|uniref:Aldehyde:ferredoxin oxidoreductase n=1 Tax=Candidatus Thermodesulfobacterium syntrophicum TaxID=3060442 RepID=A0AAE3P3Q8_9BACT|nr:Aldehyde:ferredoxin oxidoreductase [Candidatus Thermodesulfobacterium syntrophicum]
MFSYKVLFIDVGTLKWEIREYKIPPHLGPVDIGIKIHLEEVESWKYDVFSPQNVLFLGTGPFAGSKIFGTHRLVAVFRSSESLGLHVSEAGGAGYKFIGSGINGFAILGKSEIPLLIFVEGREKTNVRFEKISMDNLNRVYESYENYFGAYALTKWLLDIYSDFFVNNNARAVVVGPGAWQTRFGSLVSIDVNPQLKNLIIGSEDFAGRGGAGSVLAQAHNVAGIIAGGKIKPKLPEIFTNIKNFNEYFKKITGREFFNAVNMATIKYRLDPKTGVGGTFGSNYPYYKEWLPTFCYNSIYLKKEIRRKISDIILKNYWGPFKEETFVKTRSWKTCGEPCSVACKKIWKRKKVDYEPFQGVGPLIGVFDLKEVSKIVDIIDNAGLDAITTGHIVAFLLEAVNKGLLTCEEVGISTHPNLDPLTLNPEKWHINGVLAVEIIQNLLNKRTQVLKDIAEKGLRKAIKKLDEKYETRIEKVGMSFKDIALYQPYGEEGYMTPNFYWTLGFFVPIFVSGKYWTEYRLTFTEPEEFVKLVYERAIKELAISNAGFCRFHRGWAENLLDRFYEKLGIEGFEDKIKNIYKNIAIYNIKAGAIPKPLEGEKAIDIFSTLAEELQVQRWAMKFSKNKRRAYQEWFDRFFLTYIYYLGLDFSIIR